ncbi:MAG: ATP-binding protein [Thermodesulfobacteriota bacterium]
MTGAFLLLSLGPLHILGVVFLWQSWSLQLEQAVRLQMEISERVAATIVSYFERLEDHLLTVLGTERLVSLSLDQQRWLLEHARSHRMSSTDHPQEAFQELALLDSRGVERARVSRTAVVTGPDLRDRSQDDAFVVPMISSATYFGPVHFHADLGEPTMTMAVPIQDLVQDRRRGVLAAEIRLRELWGLITQLRIGDKGEAYLVDASGAVVAHRDPSVVLRGTRTMLPERQGLRQGLSGRWVVSASRPVALGGQRLVIVTERPLLEAVGFTLFLSLTITLCVALAVGLVATLAILVRRRIVAPIELLARVSQAISSGDLSRRVEFASDNELGLLADSFNRMAARLTGTISALEAGIVAREEANAELAAEMERRHQAERQWQESEARMAAIVRAFDGFLYLVDARGRIQFMNQRLIEHLGRDATGEQCFEALHDVVPPCPWCVRDAGVVRETLRVEGRAPRNGRWYYAVSTPVQHADGSFSQQIMLLDITDRKLAEQRLVEAHERLLTVFDSLDAAVYVADMTTYELLVVNRKVREAFGEVEGRLCYAALQEGQTGPCSFCTNDRLLDEAGWPTGVCQWETRNPVTGRWYDLRDQAIPWLDGRMVRMEIATDITERKLMEESLAAEKERLAVTLAAIAEGVLATDTGGRVVLMNRVAAELTGWDPVEAMTRTVAEVLPLLDEASRGPLPIAEPQAADTGHSEGRFQEALLRCRSGQERPIAVAATPIFDQSQIRLGAVWVFRDVTEERRLARQLLEVERLRSLGTLAAGVAHEINNPLASASLNLQVLLQRLESRSEEDRQACLPKLLSAERNIERASTIARELLQFSRPDRPGCSTQPLGLCEVLSHSLALIEDRLGGVVVDLRCEGLPEVPGDPSRLQQVFTNLLINAVEAMPAGGRVSITGQCLGDQVEIAISDEGAGIPPAQLGRIMDPFFTTKEPGKGTGLGLFVSYWIVRQHGGMLRLENRPGGGATAFITLPVWRGHAADPACR